MGIKIYTAGELASLAPVPAVVESVNAQALAAVRSAFSALREAEVQLQKLERKTDEAKQAQQRKRLALGRALVEARRAWPRSGPRAKGWGEFLEKEGIAQQTAWDLMQLAGYVEENVSPQNEGGGENLPTRAEVAAARREKSAEDVEVDVDDLAIDEQIEVVSAGAALDLRLGSWSDVLADVGMVDALITDPPYGARTHASAIDKRADGVESAGLTPTYGAWTERDVEDFVAAWTSRCRGWIVALTDSELIPVWRAAYKRHDRYAFAPVPCVITGMSVRIQGDGPSSWAVYAMVSRPRALAKWGTLPGAYVGPAESGAKSGRGKPSWLMEKLVSDYTRAGDLVCDPLAGYGTTLTAALKLGRRSVGSEIDAEARLEAIARWRSVKTGAEAEKFDAA